MEPIVLLSIADAVLIVALVAVAFQAKRYRTERNEARRAATEMTGMFLANTEGDRNRLEAHLRAHNAPIEQIIERARMRSTMMDRLGSFGPQDPHLQ